MSTQGLTINEALALARKGIEKGMHDEANQVYKQILESKPNDTEVMYAVGMSFLQNGNVQGAESLLRKTTTLAPNTAKYFSGLGRVLSTQGKQKECIGLFRHAIGLDPTERNACVGLANALLPGESYEEILSRFHAHLKPKTYVEIGIETGKTLAKAIPPTIAIGIDPKPVIDVGFEAKTKIYPVPSDIFFENYKLAEEMEHPTIDFSFLDGLHLFEQTLKDFMNIEKFSTPDTVVVVHDCLPLNSFTSSRERQSAFWTGDPWKIIPCLKQYRPDLNLSVISAQPSGLGMITNLDSSSTVLRDNWQAILDEYVDMEYSVAEEDREFFFNVVKNDWTSILDRLQQ